MSRTYRKPLWYLETSEKYLVERELRWLVNHDYRRRARVRRPVEEYEALLVEAQKKFDEKVAANGGSLEIEYFCPWMEEVRTRWIYKDHVSKYKSVWIPDTVEEAIQRGKDEYARLTRDSAYKYSRNWRDRHRNADTQRRANKNFCKRVVKDVEVWDDESAPTVGKFLW